MCVVFLFYLFGHSDLTQKNICIERFLQFQDDPVGGSIAAQTLETLCSVFFMAEGRKAKHKHRCFLIAFCSIKLIQRGVLVT